MEDSPSFFPPTARHRYTRAQKIAMVEESMRPGVSIASVARAHGINANQLHKWRYAYKTGVRSLRQEHSRACGVELLPIELQARSLSEQVLQQAPELQKSVKGASRRVSEGHIELAVGQYRLCVHGYVQPEALRSVLQALRA
jgi:transposase